MNMIELKECKNRLYFLRKILLYVIIVFTSTNNSIYYAMFIGKVGYFLINHDLLNALIVIPLSVNDVNID